MPIDILLKGPTLKQYIYLSKLSAKAQQYAIETAQGQVPIARQDKPVGEKEALLSKPVGKEELLRSKPMEEKEQLPNKPAGEEAHQSKSVDEKKVPLSEGDKPAEKEVKVYDDQQLAFLSNLFNKDSFDANGSLKNDLISTLTTQKVNYVGEKAQIQLSESRQLEITKLLDSLISFQKPEKFSTPLERWEHLQEKWKATEHYEPNAWKNFEGNSKKQEDSLSKKLDSEKNEKELIFKDVLKMCENHIFELEKERKDLMAQRKAVSENKGSNPEVSMDFLLRERIDATQKLIDELKRIKPDFEKQAPHVDLKLDNYSSSLKAAVIDISEKTKVKEVSLKDFFKNSTEDKLFLNSILTRIKPGLSSDTYKASLISMKKMPEDYRFGPEKKDYLIRALDNYISARSLEGESKRLDFGLSKNLGLNFSKDEKIAAATALKEALEPNPSDTVLVTLKDHEGALRNGYLGKIIRDIVKSQSDQNSVSGLVKFLESKAIQNQKGMNINM